MFLNAASRFSILQVRRCILTDPQKKRLIHDITVRVSEIKDAFTPLETMPAQYALFPIDACLDYQLLVWLVIRLDVTGCGRGA